MTTIETTCRFCSAPIIRKQASAMHFCGIGCKAEWQKLAKPVDEAWLRDAYLIKGMNCTEIAHIVSRDPKSVWNWLKDFGIETRKRGTTGNHVHSIGVPRALSEAGRKKLSESAKATRAKDKTYPFLKDGEHWLKGGGSKHPNWKGGISPERQAFYATQEWKDAVKAVWKRDDFSCRRCASDLRHKRNACAVHHIVSFADRALRGEVSNLILLCKPCHLWVHSKKNTNKEYIK